MTRKPITVQIMDREYTLRVDPGDEESTREIAAAVNERMQAFQEAHPNQVELTTAIITALALAEELEAARSEREALRENANAALADLSQSLKTAIEERRTTNDG